MHYVWEHINIHKLFISCLIVILYHVVKLMSLLREVFLFEGVNERDQPNVEQMHSSEPFKKFIFEKLGKFWRDYKYYLHCQVAEFEFETIEEMKENRSKRVNVRKTLT